MIIPILICRECDQLVGPNIPTPMCRQTGQSIDYHAVAGCPLGKFGRMLPGASPVQISTSIPLAGDLIASIAHRFGVDRLAKMVSRITAKDCGCDDRRKWLNKWDMKLRRRLGL